MGRLESGRVLARDEDVVEDCKEWSAAVANQSKHLWSFERVKILTDARLPLVVSRQSYSATKGSDSAPCRQDTGSRRAR